MICDYPDSHPFGTLITAGALRQTFQSLVQWEDKYRALIQLGNQLPILQDALKQQATEISGCENRVWLGHRHTAGGAFHFYGDSEGRMVPKPDAQSIRFAPSACG